MKRSSQVVLLLMGTTAVGGTAYSMMPRENCSTDRSAISSMGTPQATECARRSGSSSSGGSYRSSGGSSSSSQGLLGNNSSSSNSAIHDSGHVTRSGFGSFAHSFTSHFSGGG